MNELPNRTNAILTANHLILFSSLGNRIVDETRKITQRMNHLWGDALIPETQEGDKTLERVASSARIVRKIRPSPTICAICNNHIVFITCRKIYH